MFWILSDQGCKTSTRLQSHLKQLLVGSWKLRCLRSLSRKKTNCPEVWSLRLQDPGGAVLFVVVPTDHLGLDVQTCNPGCMTGPAGISSSMLHPIVSSSTGTSATSSGTRRKIILRRPEAGNVWYRTERILPLTKQVVCRATKSTMLSLTASCYCHYWCRYCMICIAV